MIDISIGDTVIVTNSNSLFYGGKFKVSELKWPPVHLFGKEILVYVFDEYRGKKRTLCFQYSEVEKVTSETKAKNENLWKKMYTDYYRNDVIEEQRLWDKMKPFIATSMPSIKRVIFNPPATIVLWSDGTKTVVKANGDFFDPEKGLAMAISKKSLGNKGNYYNTFKRFIPAERPHFEFKFDPTKTVSEEIKRCAEALKIVWGIK